MSSEQEKFIEFKFERNRVIDLMTGGTYMPPLKNKTVVVNGNKSLHPHFNMDYVHKVPLLDETPQVPERDELMSDRLYEELKDEAYRDAMANRKKNDVVRQRLKAFEKSGTIKIVKDPFERKTSPDKPGGKPGKQNPPKNQGGNQNS